MQQQVKESLKNARELAVYLCYYNRYLEDLKKSFEDGRDVVIYRDYMGGDFFNCVMSSTLGRPGCKLNNSLMIRPNVNRNAPSGCYCYDIILHIDCREDDRIPAVCILNRLTLEGLGTGTKKYKLYIFEQEEYKDVGWKYSTKITDCDISELIEGNQKCSLFLEKICKNLLFFHKVKLPKEGPSF